MSKKLQKKLCTLENCIRTQRSCISLSDPARDYMHGMLNGMILAHAIFADINSPKFHEIKNKKSKVRHKSCKRK
jgi:hypothetical protein